MSAPRTSFRPTSLSDRRQTVNALRAFQTADFRSAGSAPRSRRPDSSGRGDDGWKRRRRRMGRSSKQGCGDPGLSLNPCGGAVGEGGGAVPAGLQCPDGSGASPGCGGEGGVCRISRIERRTGVTAAPIHVLRRLAWPGQGTGSGAPPAWFCQAPRSPGESPETGPPKPLSGAPGCILSPGFQRVFG